MTVKTKSGQGLVSQNQKKAPKLSPMEQATDLMKQYRDLHVQQQSLGSQKNEIAARLAKLAEEKRHLLFGDTNTCNLDVFGKIAFVNETTLEYELDVWDEMKFHASYPECCEIKIKTSSVKGLCINQEVREDMEELGLSLGTKEKFTITPSK